jgi:hypothetical protein
MPAIVFVAMACCIALLSGGGASAAEAGGYFGVHVVDDQTGRGVPLVELETVHHLLFVTDSNGWAAIREPDLMDRKVFFHVRSHGYEFPKDGFGYAGVALPVAAGQKTTIKIKRRNLAERLYRVTGQGIYRDSVLLGEHAPLAEPMGSGMVAGQDSVAGEIYQGKIFWFWGDTSRLRYPLGHFWMSGAVSDLPGKGGLDPARGVDLRYFVDDEGFSRPTARMGVKQGPIWADGYCVLPDESGRERLVCHYAHMESLAKILDHGLAAYNDDTKEFDRLKTLDMKDQWAFPAQAHVIRHKVGDVEYFYTGATFPNVRAKAEWKHYLDPASREAFTCLEGPADAAHAKPLRGAGGKLRYEWKRNAKPTDGAMEKEWIAAGRMKPEETHFLPQDVDGSGRVLMHRGSVRWNAHRKCWIMIAGQIGGTSNVGEIWYAEAAEPTGPWRRAKKIVTHNRYSFYNPVHHPFFDQEGGRVIYFEGTYTESFSGNPTATPRYDYNQVMYRLDLDDPRLKAVRE